MQLTKLGVDSIVKVDNRTAGLPSFSRGEARRGAWNPEVLRWPVTLSLEGILG